MKNNSDYDMESHKDLIDSLYSHAHQELGFKKPPMLIFQSDPRNYGALSKTAQYNPSSQEITIYVDGRHIKDILRSFAHELVHHHQNEQGRLSGANVTQGEQDFDDIEGEAYHTGNLKLFRKWEDGIKENSPTIYNERRIYKMSTKKWKNKELSKLMTEKYGFKMNLGKLNENVQEETLEEVEQLDENGCGKNEEMIEGSCVKKESVAHKGHDLMVQGFEKAMMKALKDYSEMAMRGQTPEMQERIKSMKRLMSQALITGISNLKDYDQSQGREFGDPVSDEEADDRLTYGLKEEGKDEKCEKCEKAKDDCECPKEAMDEEVDEATTPKYDDNPALVGKQDKLPDELQKGIIQKKGKLKEHKVWNDRGFKMDLNKLLK